MADRSVSHMIPAPLVALAAWLVPGAGYLLIGQWARGITVGATIIGLFLAGILIAGVRVMEVPGYTDHGERRMYDYVQVPGVAADPKTNTKAVPPVIGRGWVLQVAPLSELRDKPWSVPQVMAGPIAILTAYESVRAAAPMPGDPIAEREWKAGLQGNWHSANQAPFYRGIGVLTHARINDIGSLYLSVAGLLNLMAIIDAAHRSTRVAKADEFESYSTEALPGQKPTSEKAPA